MAPRWLRSATLLLLLATAATGVSRNPLEEMLHDLDLEDELADVLASNGIDARSFAFLDRAMMETLGINAGAQLRIENYLSDTSTQNDLAAVVTDIMLGDKMAGVLANIFRGQATALKGEVRAMVDHAIADASRMIHLPTSAVAASVGHPRLLSGSEVTCTLSGCGGGDVCSTWNKDVDVEDCARCGTKKFSVNDLFDCTCEYACAVPPPPATSAGGNGEDTPTTDGAATSSSANIAGASLWLEGDDSKIAFGAEGDVSLGRGADGALHAVGNVVVKGKIVSDQHSAGDSYGVKGGNLDVGGHDKWYNTLYSSENLHLRAAEGNYKVLIADDAVATVVEIGTGGGNVGVGKQNPQAKLHVGGDVVIDGSLSTGGSCGVKGGNLDMGGHDNCGWYNTLYSSENLHLRVAEGNYKVLIADDTTAAAVVEIGTGGGNVGIGKQNPQSKLHVGGDVKIDGSLHVGGSGLKIPQIARGRKVFSHNSCGKTTNGHNSPCIIDISGGEFTSTPTCTITLHNSDRTGYAEHMVIDSITKTELRVWKGQHVNWGTTMVVHWICVGDWR